MSLSGLSFRAGGNVPPSRFVKMSAGNDYTVLVADATSVPVGISEKWLESYNATYHATSGRPCAVFGLGQTGLLTLGGTVSAGDFLIPDSTGKGVAASLTISSHQDIGARALMSGFSGESIEVRVEFMSGRQGNAAT